MFSVVAFFITDWGGFQLALDTSIKPTLLLLFFSCIGLTANLKLLAAGGPRLAAFLFALVPFLIMQNVIGLGSPGTVGMAALLLSTDDLTQDEAKRITEVLYESGNDLLEKGSTQGAQVSIKNARRGLSVPLHTGAQGALLDLEKIQKHRRAEKQATP